MKRYKDLIAKLGPKAVFIEVPATCNGVKFRGVFLDSTKTEVVVSWPVDRSEEGQKQFAKDVCLGGEPVEEFEKQVDWNSLSIVGNQQ